MPPPACLALGAQDLGWIEPHQNQAVVIELFLTLLTLDPVYLAPGKYCQYYYEPRQSEVGVRWPA